MTIFFYSNQFKVNSIGRANMRFLQKNIRNLPVILDFTLRVITRNVTVSYRNVTGLYNPSVQSDLLGWHISPRLAVDRSILAQGLTSLLLTGLNYESLKESLVQIALQM
jgi:hypothetical protein